jgi:hypothetical protein
MLFALKTTRFLACFCLFSSRFERFLAKIRENERFDWIRKGRSRSRALLKLRGSRSRSYPRTETPEKEITAKPRTGWPKKRAGSNRLVSSRFSICERVSWSVGPETMR